MLEIFVTDEFTGVKPHRLFTFHFSKDTTLKTVKETIMNHIEPLKGETEIDAACLKK